MPPGVDWALGTIHCIRDRNAYRDLPGHGEIGEILSSPLIPSEARLLRDKGIHDRVEMMKPATELFTRRNERVDWVTTRTAW